MAAATAFNLSPNDYNEGLAGTYRRPPPQNAPGSHVWLILDEIIVEI
jgi:hypothetical protein